MLPKEAYYSQYIFKQKRATRNRIALQLLVQFRSYRLNRGYTYLSLGEVKANRSGIKTERQRVKKPSFEAVKV